MSRSIRPVTAVEVSATAAIRWREQYQHWGDDDTFADGETKKSVNDKLRSCAHTPENISRILNDTWSHPKCICCESRVAVAIEFNSWMDETVTLCGECIGVAKTILGSEKHHD